EQAHRHHRRGHSLLPADEGQQERTAGDKRCEDLRARPSDVVRTDQRPHHTDDAAADEPDTDKVEPLTRTVALRENPRAQHPGDEPDRDIEPEDPVPVEAFGDRPPTIGPAATANPATVDADDQPTPFLRDRGRQDGQTHWQDHGGAQACTVRANISSPMLGARAHAADETANSARPRLNTRRRPNRSPSAAALMIPAANAMP